MCAGSNAGLQLRLPTCSRALQQGSAFRSPPSRVAGEPERRKLLPEGSERIVLISPCRPRAQGPGQRKAARAVCTPAFPLALPMFSKQQRQRRAKKGLIPHRRLHPLPRADERRGTGRACASRRGASPLGRGPERRGPPALPSGPGAAARQPNPTRRRDRGDLPRFHVHPPLPCEPRGSREAGAPQGFAQALSLCVPEGTCPASTATGRVSQPCISVGRLRGWQSMADGAFSTPGPPHLLGISTSSCRAGREEG